MPAPTPTIPVFTNGAVPGATDLNALGSNVSNIYSFTMSGFRTYKPMCIVRITGTFSPPDGSFNVAVFDTVDFQTDGMFDSFLNNAGLNSLIVRTSGVYRLYIQYTMAPGVTDNGVTETHICINGTSAATNSVSGSAIGSRASNSEATVGLSVGNQIYGVIWQSTGASTPSDAQSGGSYLVAEWLSP